MLDESKQRARDTPLDLFGRELSVLHLEFVQSRRHEPHGVERQFRILLHQARHDWTWPLEGRHVSHRLSGDGIRATAEGGNSPKRVSRTDESQHDLMPLRRHLNELHRARLNDEERFRRIAFAKEPVSCLRLANPSDLRHFAQRRGIERREEGNRLQQVAAGTRHGPRISRRAGARRPLQ